MAKYDVGLWSRVVFSLITFVNALCAVFNIPQFDVDEATVYTVVSFMFMLVAWIIGFWKNENFTDDAQIAQGYLNCLKDMDDVELAEK